MRSCRQDETAHAREGGHTYVYVHTHIRLDIDKHVNRIHTYIYPVSNIKHQSIQRLIYWI